MRISSPVSDGFDAKTLLLLLTFDDAAAGRDLDDDVKPADSGRFR